MESWCTIFASVESKSLLGVAETDPKIRLTTRRTRGQQDIPAIGIELKNNILFLVKRRANQTSLNTDVVRKCLTRTI